MFALSTAAKKDLHELSFQDTSPAMTFAPAQDNTMTVVQPATPSASAAAPVLKPR